MTSSNRVNGTRTSEDDGLLGGVLRGEWGFGGVVIPDEGGGCNPVAAVNAGATPGCRPATGRLQADHATGQVAERRNSRLAVRVRLLGG
ncbi:hypothetical protein [Poseidonocella sp. HB161398]|uniref:hypothetical protein n=1 Tax=Poseidonocella sp. HB161398 TaxID=2320855 RepID=UPI0011096B84